MTITGLNLNGAMSLGIAGAANPCGAPGCINPGDHFPIVRFGPKEWPEDQAPPYRLEIPLAVCEMHQPAFQPNTYMTTTAKLMINDQLVANGMEKAWFARVEVEWLPTANPMFAELRVLGEARFVWG